MKVVHEIIVFFDVPVASLEKFSRWVKKCPFYKDQASRVSKQEDKKHAKRI